MPIAPVRLVEYLVKNVIPTKTPSAPMGPVEPVSPTPSSTFLDGAPERVHLRGIAHWRTSAFKAVASIFVWRVLTSRANHKMLEVGAPVTPRAVAMQIVAALVAATLIVTMRLLAFAIRRPLANQDAVAILTVSRVMHRRAPLKQPMSVHLAARATNV